MFISTITVLSDMINAPIVGDITIPWLEHASCQRYGNYVITGCPEKVLDHFSIGSFTKQEQRGYVLWFVFDQDYVRFLHSCVGA